MMSDEMLKKMPHAMLQGANEMMKKPLASGAMMAGAGFAAGRGLLGKTVLGGALLRNPLTLLAVGAAGGVAAGFLLMETVPLFWPPIYQNARTAILVMFCGFALLTLTGDTQGRIRSA